MKYKLGDFVRFVEEQYEGHITKIISEEFVEVMGEDGFEIPVETSKITLVYGQFKEEKTEETVANNLPDAETDQPFIAQGVLLAITADQLKNIGVFYLVNETSYTLLVSFDEEKDGQLLGIKALRIAPKKAEEIHLLRIPDVALWPTFSFSILYHTRFLKERKEAMLIKRKIRPIELSAAKRSHPLLTEKAWLFELDKGKEEFKIKDLQSHFKGLNK